ncbi:Lactate utilization protein A [bacterium HR36]|uniref:Glycolate oxidase iron-sulfur subunit n=1 Tax=uncultured Planctomycetota bacterium TaxID=120965 RepID=H5SJS0_9BACT|nr:4Fe-4S ferredoxin iron-sulfur binding domain protein [uncultured Planctomycetota bacterium]GBD36041.1 Lactate utilization protein A [bacterium HR36]
MSLGQSRSVVSLPTVENAVAGQLGPSARTPGQRIGRGIDYELFLDCVHCGLCTAACPTFLELGTEMDSPRGRIYLMRGVVDGRIPLDDQVRHHLALCLDCRACESACPSGVQYGRLIEPFRAELQEFGLGERWPRWLQALLFQVFPRRRWTWWSLYPVRFFQRVFGLDWWKPLAGMLPNTLRNMLAVLPPLAQRYYRPPAWSPPHGPRRARVAVFLGCVHHVLFPQVNEATVRLLQFQGCEVLVPQRQVCCGALHYHAGHLRAAQQLAQRNVEAFPLDVDAIIVNIAGCGSTLKDYGHVLAGTPCAEQGQAFAAKVRDVHEFLVSLDFYPPGFGLPIQATYHDACHLCHAQQIRQQPRQLLQQIQELKLVPLSESEVCCGAAGSYNLTQPEMAERLGRRKVEQILQTGAQAVFTANTGCLLQIRRYLHEQAPHIWVAHPVEALWVACNGHVPYRGIPVSVPD